MITNLAFASILSVIILVVLKIAKLKTWACVIVMMFTFLIASLPTIIFVISGDSPPQGSLLLREHPSAETLSENAKETLDLFFMLGVDQKLVLGLDSKSSWQMHELLIEWLKKEMKPGLNDAEYESLIAMIDKGYSSISVEDSDEIFKLVQKGILSLRSNQTLVTQDSHKKQ